VQAQRRESQGDSTPALQACVREFADFDVTYELRGFINQHRLSALTQYNPLVYFPALHRWRHCAARATREFVEKELAPRMPPHLPRCVVDFVLLPHHEPVTPHSATSCDTCACCNPTMTAAADAAAVCSCPVRFTVKVVELNPLAEFAGAGLFVWAGHDRDVLLGRTPFECRVRLAVPPQIGRGDIAPAWAGLALTPLSVRPADKDEAVE
jgi:hypothetical protein